MTCDFEQLFRAAMSAVRWRGFLRVPPVLVRPRATLALKGAEGAEGPTSPRKYPELNRAGGPSGAACAHGFGLRQLK